MTEPSASAPAPTTSAPAPALGGSPSAPAPTATEIVHRPDPGMARGKWEAPSWAFYALGAVAVVFALVYVAARIGLFERAKRS